MTSAPTRTNPPGVRGPTTQDTSSAAMAPGLRAGIQAPQPAPVPEYVRTKPHFYHDPECGLLWFATEAEALAYAAESLKCFSKDARHDGEWPDEVEDMRVGIVTHATAEIGNDDDGYDYKMVPLPAAVPSPEGGPALRDAAQKALDALLDTDATGAPPLFIQAAIDDLRAALAAQPRPDADADVRELRKWLNEEPNHPLDRAALARVLAAQAPTPAEGDVLRDGAEAVAVEAYQHALNGGHIQDLYKLPQRCAARAAHQPQPKGTPIDMAGLEVVRAALEAIAKKQRMVGDVIEPVRTINDAAVLAKSAAARLDRILIAAEIAEKATQAPAPAPEKPLPAELGEWLTAIGELYIAMGRPKFEATEPTLGVVETLREAAKRLSAQAPAVKADDARDAARYRALREERFSFSPRITDPTNDWLGYTAEGLDRVCDEMIALSSESQPPVQGKEQP